MVILALLNFLALYIINVFQNALADVQSELQRLRSHFEESLNSHENTKKSLTEQVRESIQQREHAEQEVRTFEVFFRLGNIKIMLDSPVAPGHNNIHCNCDSYRTNIKQVNFWMLI